MNLHLLFLAVRMRPGFGVTTVITEVAARLQQRGVKVTVACSEMEGSFGALDVRQVEASPSALNALASEIQATHVIAHTSPFFELLPLLEIKETWAWEHGDPDPEFFDGDALEREHQIQRKRQAVYPNIRGVLSISHFIREQIQWPGAIIIPNGWEHVTANLNLPTDRPQPRSPASTAFKVGCLMRLGSGESHYKGGEILRQLVRITAASSARPLQFFLMGRGSTEDAADYEKEGIHVHLNATDAERRSFIESLDAFVSPSLWEGCNLPIIEAQALGCPAISFDTGAHPEFGAFVCGSVEEAGRLLSIWADTPGLCEQAARYAQQMTVEGLSWDISTDLLISALV